MVKPHVSTDVTPVEWDAFVGAHPDASGYHAWIWRDVFRDAFGHETRYLAARLNGRLVGVLPLVAFRSRLFGRFLISLPFVNYGGVLAEDDAAANALFEGAMSEARACGAEYVELRHRARRFKGLPCRAHKVGMVLELAPSRDAAWHALDRKVRNQIRKAERSGLVAEAGGIELLDAFYDVFAHNMRDLGTPVYSKRFFEAILMRLRTRAGCVVVRHGTTAIAAGLTLGWRKTIEAPWASSLKAYRPMSANSLLYWTILERSVEAGFGTFDFGRSSPDSGPYQFKRHWGALQSPLCWEYGLSQGATLPNLGTANPKFRFAIAAWKRLPVTVATLIGPHIVRSIP